MKANRSIIARSQDRGNVPLLGGIFAALLIVVIGLALVPTIISSTRAAQNSTTAAGSAFASVGSLVGLLPLLFAVVLIAGIIGYVVFNRGSK